MKYHYLCRPRSARGFSLIVSLILLVLVSMAATAGMRSVALQSRMSASSYDRGLAFQGSETALREAEQRAIAATAANFPATGCASGYCAEPAPASQARWADSAFTGWRNTAATVSANANTPQAIVEDHGVGENWLGCSQDPSAPPNCLTPRYRVTARSADVGRANVILQSDVAIN